MPDRQRHGRLSDDGELSRPAWELAAAQGREPDRSDPMADTTQLRRVPSSQSQPQPQPTVEPADPYSGSDTGRDADLMADPMAETTLLRRVTFPLPTVEPADPSSSDTGRDADFVADPDDADPEAEPIRSRSTRSARSARSSGSVLGPRRRQLVASALQQRRRLAVALAGVAAVGALLALPPVRAELRDSFTRKPQPYTALYFTSRPQVDGTVLTVPVSVHAVDTGTDAYTVRVWTVDAKGQVDDSQNADLIWDGQALSTVVSMPVNPAAEYVWVSLNGSAQTLHYKIAVA